jgi:AraC-like DNA-binding protein
MFRLNHLKSFSLGRYSAPAHQSVKPRQIPEKVECLEVLTGGKVYFAVNGAEQEFGFGTIFWHLPGEYTIHKYDPPNPYSCLVLQFRVKTEPARQVPRVTHWENHEALNNFVAEMVNNFYDDAFDRDLLCHYAYSRLLWEAHLSTGKKDRANQPLPVRRLVEYLNSNHSKDLLIEDMAEAAGVSAPYLYAVIRKYLGKSPHQYLLERRLKEAKKMLTDPYASVKKIGYECGFLNTETFCRSFKKHFGMTPGAYRGKYSIIQNRR